MVSKSTAIVIAIVSFVVMVASIVYLMKASERLRLTRTEVRTGRVSERRVLARGRLRARMVLLAIVMVVAICGVAYGVLVAIS